MKTVTEILLNHYGADELSAPPIALIWAAERAIREGMGVGEAQAEFSAINRKREKAGKMPAYPEYGTVLFHKVPTAAEKRSESGKKAARTRARRLANRPSWMH